jgi:N-acetylneuraminic acid mutarotase
MFLFGGNNYQKTITVMDPTNIDEEKIYNPLYSLNLRNWTWQVQKTRGAIITPRDEHTAVVDEDQNLMIIFGGFKDGERCNDIAVYDMKQNKWSLIELNDNDRKPCERSGHSAVYYQSQKRMYIFGGKDINSEKLNDLWYFDFQTNSWS